MGFSAFVLWAASLGASARGAEGFPTEAPLGAGGLVVWRFPGDTGGRIHVLALVGVGSRDEPPELAGVSHLLERCLLLATRRLGGHTLADHGGSASGVTTREYTAYSVSVPDTEWRFAVDWLGLVVGQPELSEPAIAVERRAVAEELEGGQRDVDARALESLFFEGHPLGRPVGGDRGQLDALGGDELRGWHERFYRAGNVVVAWSGEAPFDACAARIEQAFAALPPGEPARTRTPPSPAVGRVLVECDATRSAGYVLAGYHVDPGDAAQLAALLVIERVLDEAVGDELRAERSLACTHAVALTTFSDAWRIEAFVNVSSQAGLDGVWSRLRGVFGDLDELDERRFERARRFVLGVLSADDVERLRRCAVLTRLVRVGRATPDIERAVARLGRADAVAMARDRFCPERLFLLTNSPRLVGSPLVARWMLAFLAGLVALVALRARVGRRHRPRATLLAPRRSFRADVDATERALQEYFRQLDREQKSGD